MQKIWMKSTQNIEVQTYISDHGIRWKYVIEYAPWKGGFYERLVGLTKRALRKSLGKCCTTSVDLRTLLAEIEAILNSRPLVHVGDDINSCETITPAHFISINYKTGTPRIGIDIDPGEGVSKVLIENWKKGQIRLKEFWDIWLSYYLPALRERHTLEMKRIKGEIRRIPNIGEVVIIKEENLPRGTWKLAKIQSLIKGGIDGIERAANLISSSGRTFRRPFRLIYPLEDKIENETVKQETDEEIENLENEATENDATENQEIGKNNGLNNLRQTRSAAIVAVKKIKSML